MATQELSIITIPKENSPAMRRYSKDELISMIEKSHQDAAEGKVITHPELLARLREKYAL